MKSNPLWAGALGCALLAPAILPNAAMACDPATVMSKPLDAGAGDGELSVASSLPICDSDDPRPACKSKAAAEVIEGPAKFRPAEHGSAQRKEVPKCGHPPYRVADKAFERKVGKRKSAKFDP